MPRSRPITESTESKTRRGAGGFFRRLFRRIAALPRAVLLLFALVAAAGACGFALFLGFAIAQHELPLYGLLDRADRKIKPLLERVVSPQALEAAIYRSHLVNLESEVAVVDFGRSRLAHPMSENGGGLAVFGDDILLLPYSGRIYAASAPGDLRETRVTAPDIGRDTYQRAAEDPAFADLSFNRFYLRYNDIMVVESGDVRALLVSYTEYHPDRTCYTNTLAKLDIAPSVRSIDDMEAGPDSWQVLHRTEPCLPFKSKYFALEGHMAGGALAFAPPATVYMTSGDFHIDGMRSVEPPIAQNPTAEYGKLLAIDVLSGESRIVSSGHRNPQGVVVTRDGRVFVAEHGPRGGDELNLIREGANYGWPRESLGTTYSGTRLPKSVSYARHDSFEPPAFSWLPSVAISRVVEVDGFHPLWDGDLLIGSLVDESLHRVRMAAGRPVYSERIEIGARIRALHQHPDGRIVLWTDSQELIFLSPRDRDNPEQQFEEFLAEADLSQTLEDHLRTAVEGCSECHSFTVGDHARSPSLATIYGDRIASTTYEDYSDALRSRDGRWTREQLLAFLADPQAFAPGTAMPRFEFHDDETRRALVSYLAALDQRF